MANEPEGGDGAKGLELRDVVAFRWRRWALLAAVCITVGCVQARLNERYEHDLRAWKDALDWIALLDRDAEGKLNVVMGGLAIDGGERPQLPLDPAVALPALEAQGFVEISRTPSGQTRLFEDRKTGGRALLGFDNAGRLRGEATRFKWSDLRPPPPRRTTPDPPDPHRGAFGAASLARQTAYHLGFVLFAVLLIRLPSSGRGRSQAQRLAMAVTLAEVAVVSLFLASMGIGFKFAWSPLRDGWRDAGWLGVIAVLIAAAVLIAFPQPPPPPRSADGRPACAGCGYDLTGNESGVCPECGHDFRAASSGSETLPQTP